MSLEQARLSVRPALLGITVQSDLKSPLIVLQQASVLQIQVLLLPARMDTIMIKLGSNLTLNASLVVLECTVPMESNRVTVMLVTSACREVVFQIQLTLMVMIKTTATALVLLATSVQAVPRLLLNVLETK